jgi:hypothetical protein
MTENSPESTETFALSRSDVLFLGLICVAIGVGLGFFLPAIGGFASRFPIPFGDVIEKLSQFNQPWVVMLRPLIGAVLGVVATAVIASSSPRLTIGDEAILVDRHDGHPLRISKGAFSTAYFDSGKLTILTEGGHQAFKGDVEGKKDRVAEAFITRGYRWGEI